MELHTTQQTLPINEVLFDSSVEQPLECDLILPDYCPDIQRILHCDVYCVGKEKTINGSRLTVSGEIFVTVLYAGERGQVRSIQHKLPFIRNVELRAPAQDPVVFVHCRVDYVNCRAVSSRRLEVRGAGTFKIQVISCAQEELLGDCSGMGIQLKKQMLGSMVCLSRAQSPFTVREELELGSHPPISQILFTQVQAHMTDQKVISGKIVTKGELHLCMLYEPVSQEEDPQPRTLEYTLPISQIVDVSKAEDECTCAVSYHVTGWEIQPKCDLDGEARILDMEVQLTAQAAVHQSRTIPLVSDCYCTDYEADFETKNLSFLNLLKIVDDEHTIKETLSHTQPISAVHCGWCRIRDQQIEKMENGVELQGTAELYALIEEEGGQTQLLQKSCPFQHSIVLDNDQAALVFSPQLSPGFVECSLTGGGQLELKCMIQISGCIYALEHQCAVSGISIDEGKCKGCKRDCALTIYYADAGESVWDIAKEYNTSIDGVMEENGLEDDILTQRTMLLIPML